MSDLPAGIDLARHRDFEGRGVGQWLRRGFLALLLAFVIAALLNVFGEAPATTEAGGAGATLTMSAPTHLRGGLFYQARFEIEAQREIAAPVLALQRGWFEETTVNTLEPEPEKTTSDAEGVRYAYPPVSAGETLVVYLGLQANPINVGSRAAGVALYDGERKLAEIERTQVNFP